MLKFDVPASGGNDTFDFSEPMKLSTTLDGPALVAGLGGIPITLYNQSAGPTIEAKLSLARDQVLSGKEHSESVGKSALIPGTTPTARAI